MFGVGFAVTMKVIFGLNGPGQWPFLLIPPSVVTHDEDADRRLVDAAVIGVVQPMVEPAQMDAVHVDSPRVGHDAEIMAACHSGASCAVRPSTS